MEIEYYVPRRRIIDPEKKADLEQKWFPAIALSGLSELRAAACDAGYGSELTLYGTADHTSFASLSAFLLARAQQLEHALPIDEEGKLRGADFLHILEISEKGDLAFLIGTVGARLAAAAWAAKFKKRFVLEHFWHRSVYQVKAAQKAVAKSAAGVADASRDADFLMCLRGTDVEVGTSWHAVEAKGTFSKASWGQLRKGMKQAGALSTVVSSGNEFTLQEFLVSQMLIRPGKSVRCVLVDPPQDGSRPEGKVQINIELARLRAYSLAAKQFRLYSVSASSDGEQLLIADCWPASSRNHCVGVVTAVAYLAEWIDRNIKALEWLVAAAPFADLHEDADQPALPRNVPASLRDSVIPLLNAMPTTREVRPFIDRILDAQVDEMSANMALQKLSSACHDARASLNAPAGAVWTLSGALVFAPVEATELRQRIRSREG